MARHLRLEVIAEGIEQRAQLDVLRQLGCHHGQGYLLGRAASMDQTTALLRTAHEVSNLRLAM
jgi:EAL domain-containing protein (putative c-di-GMP-specific phosphodiesterase class I)